MQTVLSDYNCEGQAQAIFRALDAGGYLKLIPLELRFFVDVGLSTDAEDIVVWQHCQDHGLVLLTAIARPAMASGRWKARSGAGAHLTASPC